MVAHQTAFRRQHRDPVRGDACANPNSDRDAMVAATALEHGMTVVTRTAADFGGTGVMLVNPFEWAGYGLRCLANATVQRDSFSGRVQAAFQQQ